MRCLLFLVTLASTLSAAQIPAGSTATARLLTGVELSTAASESREVLLEVRDVTPVGSAAIPISFRLIATATMGPGNRIHLVTKEATHVAPTGEVTKLPFSTWAVDTAVADAGVPATYSLNADVAGALASTGETANGKQRAVALATEASYHQAVQGTANATVHVPSGTAVTLVVRADTTIPATR